MFSTPVILFLALCLRILFWASPSTDDQVHLWNIRLRKRLGDMKSHTPIDSILPGKRGYPTLSHHLVAFFPEKSWRMAGKALNVLYDLILVLGAFAAGEYCFPDASGLLSPGETAALLVGTSPILLPITSRIKSLGGRTLGNLQVSGYLLFLWLGMNGHPVTGILGAAAMAVLCVLTSKFAVQFIIFTTPFIALLTMNLYPLMVLAAAAVGAITIPGLGLRDVLSFMYAHSTWYVRNIHTGTTGSARNRLKDLLALPKLARANIDIFFGVLMRRCSYSIALYSFPLFWVVLLWSFDAPGGDSFMHFSAHVVFAGTFVFLITSLRPFLFLGQAERYFEYTVPYAAIVSVDALQQGLLSEKAVLLLVLLQICFSLINAIYSNYSLVRNALKKTTEKGVQDFLVRNNSLRVLTIPTKQAFDFSDQSGKNKYYYRAINTPKNGLKYKENDYAWFEMPRPDLDHFLNAYGIDTVVADKTFLPKAAEQGIHYPLDRYETVYEDDRHIVVSLDHKQ